MIDDITEIQKLYGIYRIPVKFLFNDPMDVEFRNSAPWNVIRTIFHTKKCIYHDYTEKIKKPEQELVENVS